MTKVKKVVFSLSLVFTMLIALVIGIACTFKAPQPNVNQNDSNSEPTQSVENMEAIKPETYTFEKGEVAIQSGLESIEYIAGATQVASPMAYEYKFNNPMAVDMAINLKQINRTGVTISYTYSDEPLTSITSTSNIFKAQRIEPNQTKYIYIVLSKLTSNFSTEIVWYQGEAGLLSIYDSDSAKILVQEDIVKGQDISKELSKISLGSGCYLDSIFIDADATKIASTISQGGVLYARQANLPEDWIDYDRTNKCYYVKRGSSSLPANLIIPATYNKGNNGKAIVKYIATATSSTSGVFYQKTGLTSIKMPNTITEIGDHAFGYCKYASTITLSKNLQTIGSLAFRDCLRTTAFKIPASVTSIGEKAFLACLAVTDLEVDANNKVYDSRNDCNAIIETASDKLIFGFQTTVIPEGVKTIASYSFAYITSLQTLNIPSTVTSIEKPAFVKMTDLAIIMVDEDNAVFDSRNDCNAIIHTATDELVVGCKNTVIPSDTTSIASNAFHECLNLTSITIPSSVTTINAKAFTASKNLESVTFENTDYLWLSSSDSSSQDKHDVYDAYWNANNLKDRYVSNNWTRGDLIKCCYIGSTSYISIPKALAVAKSGDVVYYYPGAERKVIFEDCTVPSGVTLRVCYDSVGTASNSVATYTSEHMTSMGGTETNRLVIEDNITLSLASGAVLDVAGELKATNVPSYYTGQTAGNYAMLLMGESSKIIAQQATIECTGYIDKAHNNETSIELYNKSTVRLPFIIRDYKGGSYMYAAYKENVSPFNQYAMFNINAGLKIFDYSSVVGYANVWLNDEVQTMEVKLVGETSDYVFQLTTDDSYVDITYTAGIVAPTFFDGISYISFNGGMKMNPLKMNLNIVFPVSITSENFHFPIPWTMNISLYDGSYVFTGQDIKILPGGSLTIGSGATVTADDVVVYASFDDPCTLHASYVKYPTKSSAILKVVGSGTLTCSRLAGPAQLWADNGSVWPSVTINNNGLSHMLSYETKDDVSGLGGPFSSIEVKGFEHVTTIGYYYSSGSKATSDSHTYKANTPTTYNWHDGWGDIVVNPL